MEIIAIIYFFLITLNLVLMPFVFGEERKPYSAGYWLTSVVLNAPLLYVLYNVAF